MSAVMRFVIVSTDEHFPVHPVVQSVLHNETPQHREEGAACVSVPTFHQTTSTNTVQCAHTAFFRVILYMRLCQVGGPNLKLYLNQKNATNHLKDDNNDNNFI